MATMLLSSWCLRVQAARGQAALQSIQRVLGAVIQTYTYIQTYTLTYLPDNTVCYIDDISIPHTWYTIEENLNNTL